jgi:hypothetical protein
MKKKYVEPLMEVVKIGTMSLLCFSGDFDDDPATDPAKARLFEDDIAIDLFDDPVITNENDL